MTKYREWWIFQSEDHCDDMVVDYEFEGGTHVREVLSEDAVDAALTDHLALIERHTALEEIAIKILRATHIGDQWFQPYLLRDDAKPVRLALCELDDYFKAELEEDNV